MPGFMPVLGSASLIYLLMSPRVNKLVYRPLMFFPVSFPDSVTEVPSLEGIVGKEYFFKGKSGQSIHGWHWHNPKAKYTFLFSHGNSGNLTIRLETSRHLLNAGASVFVYDYQGFGKSTGSPSVEGICEDAETAHDFLVRDLGLKESDILLYGESLGAAVSTYLSTVRECSGIVMQSGFSSLKRIAREHFPLLSLYPDLLFPRPSSSVAICDPAPRGGVPAKVRRELSDEEVAGLHGNSERYVERAAVYAAESASGEG